MKLTQGIAYEPLVSLSMKQPSDWLESQVMHSSEFGVLVKLQLSA